MAVIVIKIFFLPTISDFKNCWIDEKYRESKTTLNWNCNDWISTIDWIELQIEFLLVFGDALVTKLRKAFNQVILYFSRSVRLILNDHKNQQKNKNKLQKAKLVHIQFDFDVDLNATTTSEPLLRCILFGEIGVGKTELYNKLCHTNNQTGNSNDGHSCTSRVISCKTKFGKHPFIVMDRPGF